MSNILHYSYNRASDLQTCKILNGYEVDSKTIINLWDMSVKVTMDKDAIFDSKEEYDKCKSQTCKR